MLVMRVSWAIQVRLRRVLGQAGGFVYRELEPPCPRPVCAPGGRSRLVSPSSASVNRLIPGSNRLNQAGVRAVVTLAPVRRASSYNAVLAAVIVTPAAERCSRLAPRSASSRLMAPGLGADTETPEGPGVRTDDSDERRPPAAGLREWQARPRTFMMLM